MLKVLRDRFKYRNTNLLWSGDVVNSTPAAALNRQRFLTELENEIASLSWSLTYRWLLQPRRLAQILPHLNGTAHCDTPLQTRGNRRFLLNMETTALCAVHPRLDSQSDCTPLVVSTPSATKTRGLRYKTSNLPILQF